MNKPTRQFEVTIKIGAETWQDALIQLQFLLHHLEEHGPECNSIMGGVSANHSVDILQNPEMTRSRYFEELDAYIKFTRENK